MKADAERAKAAVLLGEDYKPAVPGVGAAWCATCLYDHRDASGETLADSWFRNQLDTDAFAWC